VVAAASIGAVPHPADADIPTVTPSPDIVQPSSVAPDASPPGRTLGIVGFALSFIVLTNLVGLVLSILALVMGRRAGYRNGFAIAGIVIASVSLLLCVLALATVVPALVDAAQTCERLGDGVHEIGNATYTCTPTSFNVRRHFGI
jgi:hypothetical protein